MKKDNKSVTALLRQKAEELLKFKHPKTGLFNNEGDAKVLIHELQVHQVELEMQNEELVGAKEESEAARGKFQELYDFAPAGYFTLSPEGEIIQLNLYASKLLGKERSQLINSRLGFFISADTRQIFNDFLTQVFTSTTQKNCEVTFESKGNEVVVVQLNGITSDNGQNCLVSVVDITVRKHAEEIMRESVNFLNETQMIALRGTFSIDIEKNQWVSSEVLNLIFGIDNNYNNSLEGWMSIVHPDWRQGISDQFYSLSLKQSRFDLEHKIIRQSDQLERWVHVIGRLDFDDKHKIKKIIGTVGDITERKLAEIELSESRELYADLVVNQIAGIYRIRIEKEEGGNSVFERTSLEFASDRFCELFEVSPADNLSDILSNVFRKIHPDFVSSFFFSHEVALNAMKPYNFELRILRETGIKWLRIESNPHLLPDQSTRWTGFVLDITTQKLAEKEIRSNEEKYRMLLELASDAFFHGNLKGDFILVNSNAVELTGFSREELLKMNMVNLFSEASLIENPPKYDVLLKGGTAYSERDLVRKDGIVINIEMISRMMPDGTFQAFIRDITERKRIEKALKQKLGEMEIYYELAITRERKMIALKSEINQLLLRLGEQPKY